jgi:hypothetical protein
VLDAAKSTPLDNPHFEDAAGAVAVLAANSEQCRGDASRALRSMLAVKGGQGSEQTAAAAAAVRLSHSPKVRWRFACCC